MKLSHVLSLSLQQYNITMDEGPPIFTTMQFAEIAHHIKHHTNEGGTLAEGFWPMPHGATFLTDVHLAFNSDMPPSCFGNLNCHWTHVYCPPERKDVDKHYVKCKNIIIYDFSTDGGSSKGNPTVDLASQSPNMADSWKGLCFFTKLNNQYLLIREDEKTPLVDALHSFSYKLQAHSSGHILAQAGGNHSIARVVLWLALEKAGIRFVYVHACGGKVDLDIWMQSMAEYVVQNRHAPNIVDIGSNLKAVVLEDGSFALPTFAVNQSELGPVLLGGEPANLQQYNTFGPEGRGFGTLQLILQQYAKGKSAAAKRSGSSGLTMSRMDLNAYGEFNEGLPNILNIDLYCGNLVHALKSWKGNVNWSPKIANVATFRRAVKRVGKALHALQELDTLLHEMMCLLSNLHFIIILYTLSLSSTLLSSTLLT